MKTKLEENMEEIMNIDENTPPIIDEINKAKEESKEVSTEVVQGEVMPAQPITHNRDIEADYDFVRNNLRDIIVTTRDSMDDIASIAATSESPRAYEVFGGLVKTLVDANRELLDIHKKTKELKEGEKETPKDRAQAGTQVQNAVFVGSTSELMKMIGKSQEE